MRTRLLSAAVLVPVVVILFVLGPPWLTLGICVLGALAAYETARLLRLAGFRASIAVPVVWTPLAIFGFAWSFEPSFELRYALIPAGIAVLVVVAAIPALLESDPASGFRSWVGTFMAGVYPGMLAFAAAFIGISTRPSDTSIFGYQLDSGRVALLVLVATVWTLDSAAYVVGRYIPRGHFFNHISPKKTWSGAIGGTLAAVVICAVLTSGAGMSLVSGALTGLVIAVAAQLGDLVESMLKRAAGTKDSGTLIPGHGGFLDRLDSFLFAGPALYASLIIAAGLSGTTWL